MDLFEAIAYNKIDLLSEYINNHRNLNKLKNGESLLHRAVRSGFIDLIKMLIVDGICNIDIISSKGNPPIITACRLLRWLDADYSFGTSGAEMMNLFKCIKLLIEYGCSLKYVDEDGKRFIDNITYTNFYNDNKKYIDDELKKSFNIRTKRSLLKRSAYVIATNKKFYGKKLGLLNRDCKRLINIS